MSRTNSIQIRTPEGIVFSQWIAGPVSRFLAWGIDFAIVLVVASSLSGILIAFDLLAPGLGQAAAVLMQFAVMIGYAIVLEWFWRGQTVGKRVLRLRVVDLHGLRMKPSQVVVRNLLRFVDMVPVFYLVGGIACIFSRRGQRLGDLAANTIVIRIPRTSEPDLDQLAAGKFNSFRQYPHLEARLRQRVSTQEAALALQALLRRDILAPQSRVELFAEVARHFRSVVEFPAEATDGLTDEQYVRNVVDSLFRANRPTRKTESSPTVAA